MNLSKLVALTSPMRRDKHRHNKKSKLNRAKQVIKIRDTFSHYRSDIHFGFGWDGAKGRIIYPTIESDEGNVQFDIMMENLIEYLIGYCTDFIAIATSCACDFENGIAMMSENEKEWVSARWNQDLSRARWWPGRNYIVEYTKEDIENARLKALEEGL